MVIDILLTFFSSITGALCFWLPHFSIWPQSIFTANAYLINNLGIINFIFPIDTFLNCFYTLLTFCVVYYGARLLASIVNSLFGSGGINV